MAGYYTAESWKTLTCIEGFVGDASMYKGLLDRGPLRAEDEVKYFKDTLKPHFIKRSSERATYEFPFSPGSEAPPAYTFEAVRTVFVELFCTP